MKELDFLLGALESIEQNYGVQIVIKDCYSIIRLRSAFHGILLRFWQHSGPFCMKMKQNEKTDPYCIRFGNTEMGRNMNTNPDFFAHGACVTCPFGVRELYYPIRCCGHIIGALIMGYTSCDDAEYAAAKETAASCGVREEAFAALYAADIGSRSLPDKHSSAYRELALCGEMLSLICDKLLSELHIDVLFRYDFIIDNSNKYLYPAENMQFLSSTAQGINRKMTVILNAIYYIQENYTKKITVDEIAKYCYCSSSTLSHIFAKNYGMTIGHLIQNIRCDRAKVLLRESSMSVGQIALECGFATSDYFTAVFKNLTSMTPTEYRSSVQT